MNLLKASQSFLKTSKAVHCKTKTFVLLLVRSCSILHLGVFGCWGPSAHSAQASSVQSWRKSFQVFHSSRTALSAKQSPGKSRFVSCHRLWEHKPAAPSWLTPPEVGGSAAGKRSSSAHTVPPQGCTQWLPAPVDSGGIGSKAHPFLCWEVSVQQSSQLCSRAKSFKRHFHKL